MGHFTYQSGNAPGLARRIEIDKDLMFGGIL